MDEVVTCWCGNQEWVLGTTGIRCSKCELSLPLRFTFPVDDVNQSLRARNAHKERKQTNEILKLKLDNGDTAECTGNHLLSTTDGKWVRADQVDGMRNIIIPRSTLNELAACAKSAVAAIDLLIKERPMLAAKTCRLTTLGNIRAELLSAINKAEKDEPA